MTGELEKKVIEHLEGFPKREDQLNAFKIEIVKKLEEVRIHTDKKLEEVRTHTEPAPKTLSKIEQVRDENYASNKKIEMKVDETRKELIDMIKSMEKKMDDVKLANQEWTQQNKQNNERVNRVLFGDPQDKEDRGMQGMMKDVHNKLAGNAGFWSTFFFLAKVAGSITAIGFLMAGLIAIMNKIK